LTQTQNTPDGQRDRIRNEFPVPVRAPHRFTARIPFGTTMDHAVREDVFRSKAGGLGVLDYFITSNGVPLQSTSVWLAWHVKRIV